MPLGHKNTDIKLICNVVNHWLKYITAEWAHATQRGFVSNRHLLQNGPELDAAARLYGDPEQRLRVPLVALWDFAAAFPSVAHA